MGDDELNFTEEEARCWADDPHNQAQDWGAPERALAVSLVLVVFVLILIWLASIPSSQVPVQHLTELPLMLA